MSTLYAYGLGAPLYEIAALATTPGAGITMSVAVTDSDGQPSPLADDLMRRLIEMVSALPDMISVRATKTTTIDEPITV